MEHDVIVVGSGVAGLTASAFLTKSGCSTLLCEKESTCGGLVRSFERNGFVFDGGIRALENAGALFPMIKQIGLEIELVKNHVSLGIEDQIIKIETEKSVDDYKYLLLHLFPESKDEIEEIIKAIIKIMQYMNVQYEIDNPLFLDIKKDQEYFLKKVIPWVFKYALTVRKIEAINRPVVEYLKNFTQNQRLLDIITQHFFTDTPAFFALSYIKLFLDYYYPKGGTGTLINKFIETIQDHGGMISTDTEIISIDLEKRTVTDTKKNTFGYKQLIWAADLKMLYQCVNMDALTDKNLIKLVNDKRAALLGKSGNNSVFTLNVSVNLNKSYFENIATEHFFYTPSREGQSKAGKTPINESWETIQGWLDQFFALTTYEISIPVMRDSTLAPEGKTGLIISVLFDYGLTKYINDKGWYQKFRNYLESLIIRTLDNSVYPGIEAAVIEKFSSTPLSIQKVSGNTDGAITGWAFTNNPIPAEHQLLRISNSVNTPLPGVSQAGQWTFSPSGFPISLITGKLAADKAMKALKKLKVK
jgi:phytoene dehydrogenase-like protein